MFANDIVGNNTPMPTTRTGQNSVASNQNSTTMAPPKVSKATHDKALGEIEKVKEQNGALRKQNAEVKAENEELKEYLEETTKKYRGYKAKGKQLEAQIEKILKGRKGVSTRHMQSEDIVNELNKWVDEYLFRLVKWAQPGNELKRATRMVYDGIKDILGLETGNSPMDFDTFGEIYCSAVQARLSYCRQYIQQRTQSACKGACLAGFTPNDFAILP